MIRTIIIDDEEDSRVILRNYLEMYCDGIEVVGEGEGVNSGVDLIKTQKPELVFLDVKLSPGSGFDVLQQLPEVEFEVIFVTAYDEYAVKAIRFSAIDYLQKPIDVDELIRAVKKAQEKILSLDEGSKLRYQIFKENLNTGSDNYGRIVLPTMEGFVVVDVNTIQRCEADRNYTVFYFLDQKKVVIPRTLKIYDELLSSMGFFRCHQSHLINLKQVIEYKRRKKGGIAILEDNTEIPVSETNKTRFMEQFSGLGL